MKTYKDLLGIKIEKYSLFRAPACFKHDGMRWDYIIQSDPEHAETFAKQFELSKVLKVKYIKDSGVWLIRCIRH